MEKVRERISVNRRNCGVVERRQPDYVYEESEQYAKLEVELSGVLKKDVSVELDANILILTTQRVRTSGNGSESPAENPSAENLNEEQMDVKGSADNIEEKSDEDKPKDLKPVVKFELKLRIPTKLDAEKINASMQGDGVLTLVIPIRKKKHNTAIIIH